VSTAPDTFALVTGGGTGGHVHPALAVADELVRRGHPRSSIHFVGSARGLEATAVPAAGYTIDLLPGRGFRRGVAPRDLGANVATAWGTAVATMRATRIVSRRRPRVVFGVGGYASAPCLVGAALCRVPAVVHEQNAAPGLANRVAVRLGAHGAVSLPGTALRGAVLTGNPVRAEIAAVRRDPAQDPQLVGIVGGSLGAARLNDAVLELAARWRLRADVAVRHVTGRRDYERCARRREAAARADDRLVYELVPYEDDMAGLYRRAALVVARAGAVTVAELAATGVPAVLVPLPGAPGDHQHQNARALVTAGAARELPDALTDGPRLAAELDDLLAAPATLAAMGAAARSLARPDAAARVADLVEAVADDG
jgi:undecaprenyldiphospho-muramoylpentapeptide beta-N-acetylglucosaminyltransferase